MISLELAYTTEYTECLAVFVEETIICQIISAGIPIQLAKTGEYYKI